MTETLDAPVLAYRRWRVSDKGLLVGLGVDVEWQPGVQTAVCHGTKNVSVAVYCGPDWREEVDEVDLRSTFDVTLTRRGPWPLPDGRWARLDLVKSCVQPSDAPLDHLAPSLKSKCGIWAHKQPIPDCKCPVPDAPEHGAVGVVRMWGRAVEHEDGWRSEHAELAAVVDYSGRLSCDYGAPRYRDIAEMYAEWAPDRHGWAARHDRFWCRDPFGLARGPLAAGYITGASLSMSSAQMQAIRREMEAQLGLKGGSPYISGGSVNVTPTIPDPPEKETERRSFWPRKQWVTTDRNDRQGIPETVDRLRRFYTERGARRWAEYLNGSSYGSRQGWVAGWRRLP